MGRPKGSKNKPKTSPAEESVQVKVEEKVKTEPKPKAPQPKPRKKPQLLPVEKPSKEVMSQQIQKNQVQCGRCGSIINVKETCECKFISLL
jgi:hypothetical protein